MSQLQVANIRVIRSELKQLDVYATQAERAIHAQASTGESLLRMQAGVTRLIEGYINFLKLNTSDRETKLGVSLIMNKLQQAL